MSNHNLRFSSASTFASLPNVTCQRLCLIFTLTALAGCGRSNAPSAGGSDSDSLRFQVLDDTTGLSRGDALLDDFEVARDPAGAVRARGRLHLPDGTRIQITLSRPGERQAVARTQVAVRDGRFETVPILGGEAGLPAGVYRVELACYFDSAFQPPEVMTATAHGRTLRGPGMVRGNNGIAAFVHTEDLRL